MSKDTKPTQPEPRSIEELNKIYKELCERAGALQYRQEIDKQELFKLNEALYNVNQEAAARNKLDSEAKATEEVAQS